MRAPTQIAVLAALVGAPVSAFAAQDCAALASLKLPHATAIAAQTMASGYTPSAPPGAPAFAAEPLPAFCRVSTRLAPSADSDIAVEVWLPVEGWNGKLMGVGNGAWTGSIAQPALGEALRHGYAAVSSNMGHDGASASFALGHPEKLVDFGWRATHEMTVAAKRVVAAYYGSDAQRAYFNGCSAGGRQALREAQQFPADYDGIIAGAPAADWTGRATAALRVNQLLQTSQLSASQYPLLRAAVLEACDGRDGVTDGVIDDPQRCRFDPGVLACNRTEGGACLSPAQVTAARAAYAPAKDATTGRDLTLLYPGSELNWGVWGGAQPLSIALDHFRYVVKQDPQWDQRTFDFEADFAQARRADQGVLDALDTNLAPFFARGGKLLQYHGWSDAQISPGNSVQYYERVVQANGGVARIGNAYRLFMMPGVGHCTGGEGPDTFDKIQVLEHWVEKGVAPDRIVVTRIKDNAVDRSRPLCPYPQVARYNGKGSTDTAENFTCGARR